MASLEDEQATTAAIVKYAKWEITEGGATDSTVKKYIEDLHRGGIIKYDHPFWKLTEYGKLWLERYGL